MRILIDFGWVVVVSLVGGLVGIGLVMLGSLVLPRLINRMTPNVDEDKEIVRGNRAVAEYFGRVVAASIIGLSIVVAAAVAAAILVVLSTGQGAAP